MRDWQGKRYWLIGASEGLGKALAHLMSRAGVELVLSARSEDSLKDLAAQLPGKADVVPVDVADLNALKAAREAAGEIDGMVFLAGVYWPMAAQEMDVEQAEIMVDVNFTGAVRSVGVVLPEMVARDAGHIVITGSLSGFRGLPGAVGYSASKAGVMGLAESLYCDLRRTGVSVQIINPGFIKTRLTDKNSFSMPFIMSPEAAAQEMWDFMQTTRFKKSFPRAFSYLFRLSQLMPDWLYFRLFS
ncbi:MAG: SDR family NAD(P)-dependent oxidoreductase [Pseudomonadota bacterium]